MNPLLIDIPEIIETSRLILQMPKAGFGERLHQAMLDGYDDYIRWLSWPPALPSVEMIEAECCTHHAEFILRTGIRYLIIEKATGEIIGRCAYPSFQTFWVIPQFGISYFICRNKRKQGYATEASHALAMLAFKKLNAKKVEIYCDIENTASTRIPENLNFELEYTKKGGWPRQDGQLTILQAYALFSADKLPQWDVQGLIG